MARIIKHPDKRAGLVKATEGPSDPPVPVPERPEPALANVRQAKISEIQSARLNAERFLVTEDGTFLTDQPWLNRLLIGAIMAQGSPAAKIRLENAMGAIVELSARQMNQIIAALAARNEEAMMEAHALTEQVNDPSATVTTVQNLRWTGASDAS